MPTLINYDGISPEQSAAIILNTAKVEITTEQSAEIAANTLKIGISVGAATTEGNVPVWGVAVGALEDGHEVATSIGAAPDDDTLLTEKGVNDAFDLGTV